MRTPAWQRKEGQNPKGGLNAKGRKVDRDLIRDIVGDVVLLDGMNKAFIGLVKRQDQDMCALYDIERCIKVLMERDGMTREDAMEFFSFNIESMYVGDRGPYFLTRIKT